MMMIFRLGKRFLPHTHKTLIQDSGANCRSCKGLSVELAGVEQTLLTFMAMMMGGLLDCLELTVGECALILLQFGVFALLLGLLLVAVYDINHISDNCLEACVLEGNAEVLDDLD